MSVVFDNLDKYGQGLWGTVGITVLAFALAMVIGVLAAACRVSPLPPLRVAGTVWVELMRNVPLTVLLFVFFFGFPKLGIKQSPFVSGWIVCGAYTSAFVAEAVRSGFNAVGRDQGEAARSLGLTFPRTMASVVMPQALRSVVAPLGAVFVALIKNSSLASTIGAVELGRITDDLGNATAQWIPLFIGTATAYLLLTLPSGAIIAAIDRRVAIRR